MAAAKTKVAAKATRSNGNGKAATPKKAAKKVVTRTPKEQKAYEQMCSDRAVLAAQTRAGNRGRLPEDPKEIAKISGVSVVIVRKVLAASTTRIQDN